MSDRKIVRPEDLQKILGQAPRGGGRKVALCAGVFDVVHPGHIRHLLYAKGLGDVLVAAVTADRHIDKGKHRPHVPEDLRALNVAALEAVDYVVVNEEPTPVPLIELLRPDFFAKGYEYREMNSPKTVEEATAVASYGGQMIFTPGDIVYSSSHLIEEAPPRIEAEKLALVMRQFGVTFDSLRETLALMRGLNVHVVGDLIVDQLTRTTVTGGQAKTPTLSVVVGHRESYVGGAGVVAKHLKAAGAVVRLTTVMGDDEAGSFATKDLIAAGVILRLVQDPTRPTTVKNAIVADGYRLLKVDTVDNRTISPSVLAAIKAELSDVRWSDGVVFSDFRHGIFNRATIPALCESIRAPFRVADSQVASRWGNITEFQGFDLITPNEREARFALGDQDSGVRAIAHALFEAAACRSMILKLGEKGVLALGGAEVGILDSFAREAVDPVGAGDALLAYATLAMIATKNVAAAAILGSAAAAAECEVEGNEPVGPEAVLARLEKLEEAVNYGPRDSR